MVEHTAVNRVVVGSSPTRGAEKNHLDSLGEIPEGENPQRQGSVVKRLRHRPFTAVTRVQFPSESFS